MCVSMPDGVGQLYRLLDGRGLPDADMAWHSTYDLTDTSQSVRQTDRSQLSALYAPAISSGHAIPLQTQTDWTGRTVSDSSSAVHEYDTV